jgi:hypothetical protein
MGIIEQKSVGNIFYQLIDDIFPPHSAETGTVAISKNGDIFTCISGYTWNRYVKKTLNGGIHSGNISEDFTPASQNTWYNMNIIGTITAWDDTEPQSNKSWPGFNLVNASGNASETISSTRYDLTDDTVGKFLVTASSSFRATNTRWGVFDIAPLINDTRPPARWNGGTFGSDNNVGDACSVTTPAIIEADSRDGDYFFIGYNHVDEEVGTARFDRYQNTLSVSLIEEPVLFNENGDSLSFDTNGWVVVNDDTNEWVMGTGTTFSGGTTSIYISNDNSSNTYTNTTSQVSHFYKDITFPPTLRGDVTIKFYWKCNGEVGADYSKIYLTPTSVTPTVGSEVSSEYQIGTSEYSNQSTYISETITIPRLDIIDQTKRLVFSWVNNGSSGTNPPMSIDSLRISYYVIDEANTVSNSNVETWEGGNFTDNGWTVVNDGATVNNWVVGTAEQADSGETGSYSAYISDDGGATASYNITDTGISHFYRDFTFTGATSLEFYWKCWAENAAGVTQYDYGTVVITDTGTTPTAGSEVTTTQSAGAATTRLGATTNSGKFNEGYGGSDNLWRKETISLNSYSGQTKRIVFTWVNDGSVGDDPPFVVDNIKITGIGDWTQVISPK